MLACVVIRVKALTYEMRDNLCLRNEQVVLPAKALSAGALQAVALQASGLPVSEFEVWTMVSNTGGTLLKRFAIPNDVDAVRIHFSARMLAPKTHNTIRTMA
jgi:hypothetical protein